MYTSQQRVRHTIAQKVLALIKSIYELSGCGRSFPCVENMRSAHSSTVIYDASVLVNGIFPRVLLAVILSCDLMSNVAHQ